MDPVPRRAAPCAQCPFRRDTAGRWRFPNLAEYAAGTVPTPDGASPEFGGELFACHRSTCGELCAGWLAVEGGQHPTVRLGVAIGLIPAEALSPGRRWPGLFASWPEAEQAHADPDSNC